MTVEIEQKLARLLYSVTSSERDHFISAYSLDIRESRTWDELTKSSKESWQGIALPLIKFVEGELKEAIKAGVKEVVEWVEEECPHLLPHYTNRKPKKDCPLCWQDFKKSKGIEYGHCDVNKEEK